MILMVNVYKKFPLTQRNNLHHLEMEDHGATREKVKGLTLMETDTDTCQSAEALGSVMTIIVHI